MISNSFTTSTIVHSLRDSVSPNDNPHLRYRILRIRYSPSRQFAGNPACAICPPVCEATGLEEDLTELPNAKFQQFLRIGASLWLLGQALKDRLELVEHEVWLQP